MLLCNASLPSPTCTTQHALRYNPALCVMFRRLLAACQMVCAITLADGNLCVLSLNKHLSLTNVFYCYNTSILSMCLSFFFSTSTPTFHASILHPSTHSLHLIYISSFSFVLPCHHPPSLSLSLSLSFHSYTSQSISRILRNNKESNRSNGHKRAD